MHMRSSIKLYGYMNKMQFCHKGYVEGMPENTFCYKLRSKLSTNFWSYKALFFKEFPI